MDKKKKIGLVLGVSLLLGVGIYWYMTKNKGEKSKRTGGDTGGGVSDSSQDCMGGEPSVGGGAGKYISVKGEFGGAERKKANQVFKVGMEVSVDGVPTKIIKVWRDKNNQIGALKLANGVADGKKICWKV